MAEWRLFEEGTIPDFCTPEWYAGREAAPHVEQSAHRPRLELAASFINAYVDKGATIVDLGAGDGGLFTLLDPAFKAWGYDIQPASVEAAKARGVDIRFGNVLEDDLEWGDVAVATEMIEHLVDPDGFLQLVAEHCGTMVASSPVEEDDVHHYENHAWAWDLGGYQKLFRRNGWEIFAHDTVGVFQVLIASR